MALQWIEKFDSRAWHIEPDYLQTTATLKFAVTGSEDDQIVRDYADAKIQKEFNGLFLQSIDFEPAGGGVWAVEGEYGLANLAEAEYNYDFMGDSVHITQSLATVARYGNAPDLKGAINFDGDSVQGTDVPIRKFAWSESHTIRAINFSDAYKQIIFGLQTTYNNAAFRGFAAGEILFRGATASQRGRHDVSVTYSFEASPNIGSHSVGGITVTSKLGWDYEWVRYKKKADATSNRIITVPDGVYVERILETGNFGLLGLGA